jgi:succinate-acetate transporter protein
MESGSIGRPAAESAGTPAAMAQPQRSLGWLPADPVPLGISGFALTTFILGLVNANVLSSKEVFVVLSVAGAYGGLAQLLAGMWAFAERNTFAAAAFSSYGAFWISFVLLIQFFVPEAQKAGGLPAANHAIGIYLFCWGFFTFYMWIPTFRMNIALNLVFLLLWVAYLTLGLPYMGIGGSTLTHWGGYVTCACAVAAWYVGASHVITSVFGRTLLPLGPLGAPAAG